MGHVGKKRGMLRHSVSSILKQQISCNEVGNPVHQLYIQGMDQNIRNNGQQDNGGVVVTEIPFVDEDTERELFSLLGDWYEPESIESLFSSMPSDAVFFSS